MTTIRRIYAYLLSFAGLAMLTIASANLGQLVVDVFLRSPVVSERYVRDTASLYGAAALVGLPAWLLHWLWIQRSARSDSSERASVLRRVYLYAVLAGATLVAAVSLADVMRTALGALLGVPPSGPVPDAILRPLPFTIVALCVWFPHLRVTTQDRLSVGEAGGSASLRRWYTYGAALIGFLVMLSGTRGLADAIWRAAAGASLGPLAPSVAAAASAALIGLGLWLAHWVVLPRRLGPGARDEDGTAVLRTVYLFLALAIAVVATLGGLSELLYYSVARMLGVEAPGGVGGDLLQAAAEPATTALVYGGAWAYQRAALRQHAAMYHEAPRQAGIRRLYTHIVALVALAALATGVSGLLWMLGDLVLASASMLAGNAWREQVALFATMTVVGLPVWVLHWRARPASEDDSHALARRLYLYLSLIVAALTLIGSAAAALYRLLGLALGGSFGTDVATDLAHALAVATVAVAVGAYHWRALQWDTRRARVEAARPVAQEECVAESVVVEIRAGNGASLADALNALRATGVEVTIR